MKKILPLALLTLGTITMVGCANNQNSSSSSSSSSHSASTSSSISSSTENKKTVQIGAEDSTHLLTTNWTFDHFTVNQIKAEAENNVLELEIKWQNTSNQTAVFADSGEVIVSQNGKTLKTQEKDDDYNDNLLPGKDEDFELDYRYDNTNEPIKISIHPADTNRPTKTVTVQLTD
ncbi:hypothetical protein [Paucilactobacillus wasatchensis]|uniref:hypothetical protein n=1 Tax=Paucilactobacillus wasatchensis TaxID=1335616 RepID=UPI0005C57549|nr:hypothetical protein [Paucilactobacillus wasatchensis]